MVRQRGQQDWPPVVRVEMAELDRSLLIEKPPNTISAQRGKGNSECRGMAHDVGVYFLSIAHVEPQPLKLMLKPSCQQIGKTHGWIDSKVGNKAAIFDGDHSTQKTPPWQGFKVWMYELLGRVR